MWNGLSLNPKETKIIKFDSHYQNNALVKIFYKAKLI